MNKSRLISLILVFLLLFSVEASAGGLSSKTNVLVRFKTANALSKEGLKDISNGRLNIARADLTAAEINRLKSNKNVLYIEPNDSYQLCFVPNDPVYTSNQYYWANINANTALDTNQGNGVTVAVLDSGVDLLHPDMVGQLVAGYNVVSPGTDPQDDSGHGTKVSGIIAAATNNTVGVAGLAPQAKIMPVKIFEATGNTTDGNIVNGITWAVNNGAKVINISFGATSYSNGVKDAIEWAFSQGVVLVASSGNVGDTSTYFPASYPQVISVGSTSQAEARSSFSNYGSYLSLVAPGENIYSTAWVTNATPQSTYTLDSGTSFSTPQVAAAAALLISRFPSITPGQVKYVLEKSARDLGVAGRDDTFGWGMLDMSAALVNANTILATLPAADSNEPNNGKSTAVPIVVNSVYAGNFSDIADADYYKLTFTANSTFTLRMTSSASTPASVAVENSAGTIVANATLNNTGGETTLVVTNQPSGDYYVVFRQANGDPWSSGEQYTFQAEMKQTIGGALVATQGLTVNYATYNVSVTPLSVPGYTGPNPINLTPAADGTFVTSSLLPGTYRITPTYPANYLAKSYDISASGVNISQTIEVWPGNINDDNFINATDLAAWNSANGATSASPTWSESADINKDGVINIKDLVFIAVNYLREK